MALAEPIGQSMAHAVRSPTPLRSRRQHRFRALQPARAVSDSSIRTATTTARRPRRPFHVCGLAASRRHGVGHIIGQHHEEECTHDKEGAAHLRPAKGRAAQQCIDREVDRNAHDGAHRDD